MNNRGSARAGCPISRAFCEKWGFGKRDKGMHYDQR